MIVKEDFLNKLRQFFGLNLYEVRIWTALLSRGVSTAGELSDIGDVPRSRAYDVLESLEKKGFVLMKVGKPIKYLAVEPKEVVERVKRSIKDDAEKNILKLKELNQTNVISELNSLYKNGVEFVEPADLSGAIRGRHNIYSHLETMIKKSTKSVSIVTTSKGVLRKIDTLSPALNKLAKKGVKIRISAPETEENKKTLKDISRIAEIKNIGKIDARFCIVDGNEMMFMMMSDDEVHPTYDLGIWVNTPYFAGAMEDLLNNSWNNPS
jgi:sugar-specific transcriptional regulator TrmB|tara:strand:- start:47 stop:844 length:798 start_codon:yes stop_codon:yes gene_type:complete